MSWSPDSRFLAYIGVPDDGLVPPTADDGSRASLPRRRVRDRNRRERRSESDRIARVREPTCVVARRRGDRLRHDGGWVHPPLDDHPHGWTEPDRPDGSRSRVRVVPLVAGWDRAAVARVHAAGPRDVPEHLPHGRPGFSTVVEDLAGPGRSGRVHAELAAARTMRRSDMRPRRALTRLDAQLEETMTNLVRTATSLVAVLVFAACGSGSPSVTPASASVADSPASSPSPVASAPAVATPAGSIAGTAKPATPIPSAAPSAAIGPTTFTSTTYGYSLHPCRPVGVPCRLPRSGVAPAPRASKIPSGTSSTGPGPRARRGSTRANDRESDGIHQGKDRRQPRRPRGYMSASAREQGSDRGRRRAGGVACLELRDPDQHRVGRARRIRYSFGMRDPAVHAATDPTDRAALLKLLKSVNSLGDLAEAGRTVSAALALSDRADVAPG